MKEIKLSRGLTAIVDDEIYDFVNQFKWYAEKAKTGYYAARGFYYLDEFGVKKHRIVKMHRQILGVLDESILVDHVDLNGLNNQKINLRKCNLIQNNRNRRSDRNTTSKYKGVCLDKRRKKWRSNLTINGKQIYLGSFDSEYEAAMVYNESAKINFGEFAYLNK